MISEHIKELSEPEENTDDDHAEHNETAQDSTGHQKWEAEEAGIALFLLCISGYMD